MADSYRVEEMNDGGMGSLHFVWKDKTSPKFGGTSAEIELLDQDQVPVMVYLDVDREGDFFELNIWKVDFSPIIHLDF